MERIKPPKAPDHLTLAVLPCSLAQCNHCGKKFSRNSSLSKHMFVVHGAGRPSKTLHERYLAKLITHRRISFTICYITFNTRFSLKMHMKSEAHLLAPGPAGVKGRFVGEFMLLLDGNSERQRETGFTSVMSVTRISSLCQRITSTRFGSTLAMCVSARVVARSSTPTVAYTDTRSFSLWGKDHH